MAVSFNRCFIFVLSKRFLIEGVIGVKYWDFAWSKQVWRFRWGFLVEFAPWIAMSMMGRDGTGVNLSVEVKTSAKRSEIKCEPGSND